MELATIMTTDQVRLQAEVYGEAGQRTLVINPAIGVKRRLYRPLAEYFTTQGITTVLYNYRGMEDGLAELPAGVDLSTLAWGRLDQSAVLAWTQQQLQPAKLVLLGHSIGGQLPGFATNIQALDGLIHVAAQKGDKRLWPTGGYLKLFLLWHVLIPLLARGHTFNAKVLGLGGYPWPAAAALQWAAWGRQREYLFNPAFGYDLRPWHQFDRPLLSWGFSDDHMAPEPAIDGLLQEFKTAHDHGHIAKHFIEPHSMGLKHIGHFGFFKPEAKALWQTTATWILQL
ncbi:alpha/beta hydrolase family protein [Marinicella meishanensis]|uniref:alpha/beta hydrolase family protein n=1 Tax=Marinicella meishanensis TaxID=2873263 RepID=UPI001CBE6F17|nr:alpha/beta fold hydrolase [Marinicella sp. NBU2979]